MRKQGPQGGCGHRPTRVWRCLEPEGVTSGKGSRESEGQVESDTPGSVTREAQRRDPAAGWKSQCEEQRQSQTAAEKRSGGHANSQPV